jgi:hypothetical protein
MRIFVVGFVILMFALAAPAEMTMLPAPSWQGIEAWKEHSSYGAGNFFSTNGSALTQSVTFAGGDYRVYIRTSTSPSTNAGLRIVVQGKTLIPPMQAKVSKYGWVRVATVSLPPGVAEIRVEPPTPGNPTNDNFGAVAFASTRLDDRVGRTIEFFDWLRHELTRLEAPRPAPHDAVEARARQDAFRRELMQVLGLDPLPERTPLNPQVLGRIDKGDYVIEKIAFESRPRHVVAALLYLPKDTSTPVPAVISAIGHWSYGKSSKAPQLRGISLAKHGYAVLAVEGVYAWERRIPGNSESYDPLVAGGCIAGHEVWDIMRAADYLETRPDVDPGKLAVTGASGGGLQASYAGAVDERFGAVLPAVALWHMPEIAINEIHSADNWVPDISRLGSMSMLIALTAPRPVLMLNVDADYSTSYFLELMVNAARPYYRLLGTEDALWQTIEKSGHDYTKVMREASRGFLDKWLKNSGGGYPVPEPDIESELYGEEDPELLVFEGKGIPAEGAETVTSIWRAQAVALRAALKDGPEGLADKMRNDVLRLPLLEAADAIPAEDGLLISSEPGIHVAVKPVGEGTRAVIWVGEADIDSELQREEVQALASRARVFVLEPRGAGMRDALQILQQGPIVMGRPLAGMWAFDVMSVVDYLARHESFDSITVAGRGFEMGLVALLATVLDPRIDRAAIDGLFSSFVQLVGSGPLNPQIPGVLKVADVEHLVRAAGSSRVRLNNMQGSEWQGHLTSTMENSREFFLHCVE